MHLTPSSPGISRAQELKSLFDQASSPLAIADLVGAYLGRCYAETSDGPHGMILSTVKKELGQDQGPLFPPTTVYNLGVVQYDNWESDAAMPASYNDSVSQSDIDDYWSRHTTVYKGSIYDTQFADLVDSQNTVSEVGSFTTAGAQTANGKDLFEVRKGEGGYLYARAIESVAETNTDTVTYTLYCYFYQRLW